GDLRQGGLCCRPRRDGAAGRPLRARGKRLLGDRRRARTLARPSRERRAAVPAAPRRPRLPGARRRRLCGAGRPLLLGARAHRRVADVAAALHVSGARLLRRGRAAPRARHALQGARARARQRRRRPRAARRRHARPGGDRRPARARLRRDVRDLHPRHRGRGATDRPDPAGRAHRHRGGADLRPGGCRRRGAAVHGGRVAVDRRDRDALDGAADRDVHARHAARRRLDGIDRVDLRARRDRRARGCAVRRCARPAAGARRRARARGGRRAADARGARAGARARGARPRVAEV
ncbi:MAG: Permease of the drug/metabolite transporter (DMT) superfamily, partial [uncultured Solirubrobacteraceae bacterium]